MNDCNDCRNQSVIDMIKKDTVEIKSDVKLLLAYHNKELGAKIYRRNIFRKFSKVIIPLTVAIIAFIASYLKA